MSRESGTPGRLTFWQRFLTQVTRGPEAPALELESAQLNYRDLLTQCEHIAAALQETFDSPEYRSSHRAVPRRAGVIAGTEGVSYAAFLACLASGVSYVPIDPGQPEARLRAQLRRAELGALVLAPAQTTANSRVIGACPSAVPVIDLDRPRQAFRFQVPSPDSEAYVLFTSGSSGEPKGVPITHANLESYIGSLGAVFPLPPGARCAQVCDQCFDLSIHELLLPWMSGATLVPIPVRYRAAAGRFVMEQRITAWLSTPSVGRMCLDSLGGEPGSLPQLRIVAHVGEPFSRELAVRWRHAAPCARILNGYGPTEATIVASWYEWRPERPCGAMLPIGDPLPAVNFKLVPQRDGDLAELLLSGSQLFHGYLGDSEADRAQTLADGWYATGDLFRGEQEEGLVFAGRRDLMVKHRGYRVELLELERAFARVCPERTVAVTALPWGELVVEEFVFCATGDGNAEEEHRIRRELRDLLPAYGLPGRILFFEEFPVTSSGKLDRRKLAGMVLRGDAAIPQR